MTFMKKKKFSITTILLISTLLYIVLIILGVLAVATMLYFLLIIIGVVAVVGSLIAYRAIQQARIPTFIKNIKAMKKEIKGQKLISDYLLYPSKNELIVKELGDKWELIGLSLENILGIETKKQKIIP